MNNMSYAYSHGAEAALSRLGLVKTADPLSAYLPRYSPEILERIRLRAGGGALAGGYGGMVAGAAQNPDGGGASGLLAGAALGGLAGGAHGALTLPRLRSANIFGPRRLAPNSEAQTITDLLNAPVVPKTRDLLSGAAVGAIPGLVGGSAAGAGGSSDEPVPKQ
jgi:hypothetical protein